MAFVASTSTSAHLARLHRQHDPLRHVPLAADPRPLLASPVHPGEARSLSGVRVSGRRVGRLLRVRPTPVSPIESPVCGGPSSPARSGAPSVRWPRHVCFALCPRDVASGVGSRPKAALRRPWRGVMIAAWRRRPTRFLGSRAPCAAARLFHRGTRLPWAGPFSRPFGCVRHSWGSSATPAPPRSGASGPTATGFTKWRAMPGSSAPTCTCSRTRPTRRPAWKFIQHLEANAE